MSKLVIKNITIATLGETNQVLKNQNIVIENGIIKSIESIIDLNEYSGYEIIDGKNRLALPGFINTHTHYYSSFARGLTKADPSQNFSEILENMWWRLDKKLSLEDCYYSALVSNIDAIKNGTTTLIDHHASPNAVTGSLFKIKDAVMDSGLRASLCYELSDRDGKNISQKGIDENISFIKDTMQENSNKIKALFGMHASFTIDDSTMERASIEGLEIGAGFHIHCAEDISDQQITQNKFKKSVIERLSDFKLLGPKTILAHGIHLSDHELDLVRDSDSIIVHNPQSNMNNAVGFLNIFKVLNKGILLGLGTDAMTTNMLEELRSAIWAHKLASKNPSAAFVECTQLLVENNKKIIDRYFQGLGEIKVGNQADIIIYDYNAPTPITSDNFYGHLVFGLAAHRPNTTIVDGEVLMKDFKLTKLDEEKIMAKSRECALKLWHRF